MVCLSRHCLVKFFKGCLPQILLGPFLNTLTQRKIRKKILAMTVTLQLLVTFYLNEEQKWNEVLINKDQAARTCKKLDKKFVANVEIIIRF